jgi:hypothetical protein
MPRPQQFQDKEHISSTGLYHFKEGSAQILSGSASTVICDPATDPDGYTAIYVSVQVATKFAIGEAPTVGEHEITQPLPMIIKAGEKIWVDGDAVVSELD